MELASLHDVGKAGAGFCSKGVSDEVAQAWRRRTGADWVATGLVHVVGPLFEGDRTGEPLRAALGVDDVPACGGQDGTMKLARSWAPMSGCRARAGMDPAP